MKCYFCQLEFSDKDRRDRFSGGGHYYCSTCQEINGTNVITTIQDGNLLYAHLYATIKKNGCLYQYHIILYLQDNKTFINDLEVPGFSINPNNLKDKLHFYLVFS